MKSLRKLKQEMNTCRFYVRSYSGDGGDDEYEVMDRLTGECVHASRDDNYCYDEARWLNSIEEPRLKEIRRLQRLVKKLLQNKQS